MEEKIQKTNLDLTLKVPSKNIFLEQLAPLKSNINLRVTNQEIWSRYLNSWINFIRRSSNLTCPKIVRLNTSFSLGLELTDDATIKAMNSKWRNKNEKTDVLSFPALDHGIILPTDQCVELGDIIISIPTAILQASENKHALERELYWLASHGLLHLLGWEHPNEKKLNEMLNCQEQLLEITSKVHDQHEAKGDK